MSLRFGILFGANTSQAKAGVKSLQSDFKVIKGDIHSASAAVKHFNGDLGMLSAGVNLTNLRVKSSGSAFASLATDASAMGGEMDIAAGSVGNVFAQLNDIGVMMAAGQNPLQLAIQQGTQLNQVFGPLGVRGSMQALGKAVLAMVSPMSLLTIGTIAAGSAIGQWIFQSLSMGESAESVADKIEKLDDQLQAYRDTLSKVGPDNEELAERFGKNAEAARALLEAEAAAQAEILRSAGSDLFAALGDPLDLSSTLSGLQSGSVAKFFDLSRPFLVLTDAARDARDEVDLIAQTVIDASNEMDRVADGGSLEAQIAAAQNMLDVFTSAADASGERSDQEAEYIQQLRDTLITLQEIAATTDAEPARIERAKQAYQQLGRARIDAETFAENLRQTAQDRALSEYQRYAQTRAATEAFQASQLATQNDLLARQYQFYGSTRLESKAAVQAALEAVAANENQAKVLALIAQHGADSALVTRERVQQERDAFVELTNSRDVSEDLKTQLIAAWDAANGVASVDMAGNVSIAADEAGRLAENLARAIALNPVTPEMMDEDAVMAQDVLSTSATRTRQANAVTNFKRLTKPKTSGRRSSGASEAERQAEAIERLIAAKEQELAIELETDPVQKEMIRNRETLASATDAQRARVEALIAQQVNHRLETEQNAEMMQRWEDIGTNALESLIARGDDLSDVLKQLAFDVVELILTGQQLGSGGGSLFSIFSGLFGGSSATAATTTAAAATPVIVPTASTTSALFSATPSSAKSETSAQPASITQNFYAAGNDEVKKIAYDAAQNVVAYFSSELLPDRVSEIQKNPRAVG